MCALVHQFLYESVVAVAFQSVFRAEMHQNDIVFILKKLILRLAHQNDLKHKKIEFLTKIK